MSILDKIQLHNAVKQAGQGKVNVHQKPKPVGDGISDSIQGLIDGTTPANFSSGEFVMPADVVSALGEGDTNAGSKVLADLIDSIRNADMKQLEERQKNPPKNVDTKEADEDNNFFLGGTLGSVAGGIAGSFVGQPALGASIGGSLGSSLGKSSAPGTSRTDPNPPWLREMQKRNLTRAEEASLEEFTPYATEDRIAGFTPDELQAQQMVRDRIGSEQGLLDMSSQGISDVLSRSLGDPQTEVQPYLNPYVEGALETTIADLDDRFDAKRQDIRSQAGGAGAFGGSRQAILEGRAEEGRDRAIGDVLSRGRMDAYDRAFGQRGSDLNRAAGAAGQAGNIARTSQQVGLGDIASLSGSGQDQRFLDQTGRDFDYQQFLEERDWDITRSGQLAEIMGKGKLQGNTARETSSPLAQSLGLFKSSGLGDAIGGIFGGGGGGNPLDSSPSFIDHTNIGGGFNLNSGGKLKSQKYQDGGQLKKPNSVLESILSNISRPVIEAGMEAGSSMMDILNNAKMNEQETKELLGIPSEQPPEMWAGVPQEVGEVPDAVKTVLNPNAQDNAPEYGVDPALKESKKTTQDTLPSVKEEVSRDRKIPRKLQEILSAPQEQSQSGVKSFLDSLFNPTKEQLDNRAFGARLATAPGNFAEGYSQAVLGEQASKGQQAKDEAAIKSTEAQSERARAQIDKWLKEPEAAKLDIVSKMANRAAMAANKKAEAAAAMMEDPGDWSTNFQVYLRDMMAPFPDEIKRDVLSRLGEVRQEGLDSPQGTGGVMVGSGPPTNN